MYRGFVECRVGLAGLHFEWMTYVLTMKPISAEVACQTCGKRNRIPIGRLDASAKCGACGSTLPPTAVPLEVDTLAGLQFIVETSPLPVVVDFWAAWCMPCRMVAPEMVKIAAKHSGEWLVVKANTERDPQLGAHYRIRSIPMMAVFYQGRELGRVAGARPARDIEAFVGSSLSP